MQDYLTQLTDYIWNTNARSQPFWKRVVISISRFVYLIISDLSNGQLNLRAMSLVFTTILSFVPLIAVSFSVLKAFGVHNQVEPALLNLFSNIGDNAPELTSKIIGFVDNVKVGLLGTVGIAFLFYSVISLLTKIEEAFNYTWRIHKTRTLTERFSNYLSVLMVGPVLVFSAIAITASLLNSSFTQSLASVEPFGTLLQFITKLIPYVLIILAFTFVYLFVPNTKVKFVPALTGGIVAGVLWQSVGYVYALVIAKSSTQTAIYASFAILFFLMTWLYLNWLILLVGSSVSFYRQHPECLMSKTKAVVLNNYDREHIALNVLLMIAANFYNRQSPMNVDVIVDHLSCPKQSVEEVLCCYEAAGILQSINYSASAYLPATPMEDLTVSEAYSAIRSCYAVFAPVVLHNSDTDMAQSIIDRVESAIERELGDLTIKQVLQMNSNKAEKLNLVIA